MPDSRGIALDEVGVEDLGYPILVADGQGGKREVDATVSMSVSLGSQVKGAHLSRFVDVLHSWRDALSRDGALDMVDDLRERMGSATARARLAFPYYLERQAPATNIPSFTKYACVLTTTASAVGRDMVLQVRVPVTSVCPCSKAISDRGAHNQRGWVTIEARPVDPCVDLWFDDLITIAESAGSSPVYTLLKRPDERHVTMAGYDNPVFVEDMARTVAQKLQNDSRVAEFKVRIVNDESIHNHAAYAQIAWTAGSGRSTEERAGG